MQVKRLADLVAVGVGGGADEHDALTPLLMFFENISAAPGGATLMTNTAEEYNFMLLSIARQMASSNSARQLCSAGALKNCCFERTVHPFIAEHVELAALLCLPLVGDREGFDEEDIKDMPSGLGRKCRIGGKVTENVELREVVYETMMLLCRTREGRDYLRESKIYPVIREFPTHLWQSGFLSLSDILVMWGHKIWTIASKTANRGHTQLASVWVDGRIHE